MKRKIKKIVSLALCCIMLAGAFSVCSFATDKSSVEAINWVKSQLGNTLGSGDCVGLVRAYYSYLGVTPHSGNAISYSTVELPEGWTRTQGGTPQNGDIIIYNNGTAGHVGIYNASEGVSYHQNWSGKHYVTTVNGYVWANYYWGCIHPTFTDDSSESNTTTSETTTTLLSADSDNNDTSFPKTDTADLSADTNPDLLIAGNDTNSISDTVAMIIAFIKTVIQGIQVIYTLIAALT